MTTLIEEIKRIVEEHVVVNKNGSKEEKVGHLRHVCPVHKFWYGDHGSTNNNHLFCKECFCPICSVPASRCNSWFNEKSSYSENHCNAYNVVDSEYTGLHSFLKGVNDWRHKYILNKNPLLLRLANLQYMSQRNQSTSEPEISLKTVEAECINRSQNIKLEMDRAFRLYETGEERESRETKETTLHHNFTHVTDCFTKFWKLMRHKVDDKWWIKQFIMLDAMTEIFISHTYLSDTLKAKYDQCILRLGSRWLAYCARLKSNFFDMANAIQARLLQFKNCTDVATFDSAFAYVLQLTKCQNNTFSNRVKMLKCVEDVTNKLIGIYEKALASGSKIAFNINVINLRILQRFFATIRQEVARPFPLLAFLKVFKGLSYRRKDGVEVQDYLRLPKVVVDIIQSFLYEGVPLLENIGTKFRVDPMKSNSDYVRCKMSQRMLNFYLNPKVETLSLLGPFKFEQAHRALQKMITATFSFSTKQKKKFKRLFELTRCFIHIAIVHADHVHTSKRAFEFVAMGLRKMKEVKSKCTEMFMLDACLYMLKEVVKQRASFNTYLRRDLRCEVWPALHGLIAEAINVEGYANKKTKLALMFELISLERNPFGVINWKKLGDSIKVVVFQGGLLNFSLKKGVAGQVRCVSLNTRSHYKDGLLTGKILVELRVKGKKPVNVSFMKVKDVENLEFWNDFRGTAECEIICQDIQRD